VGRRTFAASGITTSLPRLASIRFFFGQNPSGLFVVGGLLHRTLLTDADVDAIRGRACFRNRYAELIFVA